MDTDIRDELDRSFGDGPPPAVPDDLLARGHRALWRRRLAEAGTLLAAGVVVAGGAALATGGHEPDSAQPMAPTASASPTPATEPTWEDDTPIQYRDGELQVRPGVVVHQHVPNPYGYEAPRLSDALDLTYQGQRMWILAETGRNGFGYVSTVPSNGWASFRAWVDDQVGTAVAGDDGWPDTVRLDARGDVVAGDGARIVQRTDDPRLGARFAPAGAVTGAAVVTVAGDDASYFVVWRVLDGRLDVVTTPPRDVVGATFDELLTHARAQYASGEGLR